MSYYGGDRFPTRGRATETKDYAYSSNKPVTRRVGDGRRTRLTVETGGDDIQYQQQYRTDETIKREQRLKRLEEYKSRKSRPSPLYKPTLRYERTDFRSRRNSYPIRIAGSSPSPVHSRPATDAGEDSGLEIWSPTQSSEDDDDDAYDFDFPKPAKGSKFLDDSVLEIPKTTSIDKNEKPPQIAKQSFNGPMTEVHISHSRWLGSSLERGDLVGEIVTTPSVLEAAEKHQTTSMKWYHLERFMMNFEEFTAACLSVLDVPEKEHRDILKLLRDVQKKFEKQRHHGRDLEPDCVSDVFYNKIGDKNSPEKTESVMFLNFPYFSLDAYSSTQIKALAPGSPKHPLRPILEAHFYATSRNRELAQVITRMTGTPEGQCLHLSQIWCLIINGRTMVTCSRLPLESLGGDLIKMTQVSPQGKHAYITISAMDSRSWRMPVSRNTSWPAFLALFEDVIANMKLYGSDLEFKLAEEVVDGKSWPDVVERALISHVELRMRDVRPLKDDPTMQMLTESVDFASTERLPVDAQMPVQPDEENGGTGSNGEKSRDFSSPKPAVTLPVETSHTLQLFKHTGSPAYLRNLADSFHDILRTSKRGADRIAYQKCRVAKYADVESWLASHDPALRDSSEPREAQPFTKYKRRLASLSRYLFCLFWPSEFEHPLTDKYWGAIYLILGRENEFLDKGQQDSNADIAEASSIYHYLHDDVLPIALALSREFINYETDLRPLPEAFSKAWLHVVMAVVLVAETTWSKKFSFVTSGIRKHLQAARKEFSKAKSELAVRLRGAELENLEICDQSSLLALFLNRLARDNIRGQSDVAGTYGDYFQVLEFNMTQDPVPRSHQETIRFFLKEVEAILETLQNQMSVVDTFERSLQQQSEDSNAVLEEALGDSRQSLVIESCKAWIGGRIDKFKGLQQRALELGEWHLNEIDTHKDRQEKAILVFTIVTIIFLPLSFVAGVFGMNTLDIRDMPYKQWIYWATGIPLTIIVVVASLWFAGELEGLGRWLARTTSRSKTPSRSAAPQGGESEFERPSSRIKGFRTRNRQADLEERTLRPKRRTTYPVKDF